MSPEVIAMSPALSRAEAVSVPTNIEFAAVTWTNPAEPAYAEALISPLKTDPPDPTVISPPPEYPYALMLATEMLEGALNITRLSRTVAARCV